MRLVQRLLAWSKTNGVSAEVVDRVVLSEESAKVDISHESTYRTLLTHSPTIQRGPMGAGMSMPVKEEIQVPPALST